VAAEAGVDFEPRLLFTAPWEPLVVRRGDALGLRALADSFAEAIAPDLSNRVRDGRWVTILAWCLVRSQEVFHASGGRSVATRAQQRERYAWLRPLELMWVARTIALAVDWRDRSLAGQRRVRPWYENGQFADRFGMSMDQFRAYRQIGMYGGYRLAFRKWPGMTVLGDGWTPGSATNALAKWLDQKLGKGARPTWPLHGGAGDESGLSANSAKRGRDDEHHWWPRKWPTFDQGRSTADHHTLPRRKSDFAILPESELLKPLVFGDHQNGRQRAKVAIEVENASANTHIQICEHLGREFVSNPTIKLLPRFSRLADAGMAAMDLVAEQLRNDSHVELADVAALPASSQICAELIAAAREWLEVANMQFRHIESAHRFAGAITSVSPPDCLRALLEYHERYGGGLRWFVLRDGTIVPRTPPGAGSSRYRFRLWSLCRLATQCGVLDSMPPALDDDAEEAETAEVADG
jgi:hypothetical protein